jgi:hypothetical protein
MPMGVSVAGNIVQRLMNALVWRVLELLHEHDRLVLMAMRHDYRRGNTLSTGSAAGCRRSSSLNVTFGVPALSLASGKGFRDDGLLLAVGMERVVRLLVIWIYLCWWLGLVLSDATKLVVRQFFPCLGVISLSLLGVVSIQPGKVAKVMTMLTRMRSDDKPS